MATVKLGIKDIPTPQLLAKAKYIIGQITRHAEPSHELDLLRTATDELQAAYLAAQNRGTQEFNIKKEKQALLLLRLRCMGGWVQSRSGGSAVFIGQCGFETRKRSTRLGIAPPPEGVVTVFTSREGALLLRWKPVHGKRSYNVEINAGDALDESQWKMAQTVTKTKAEFTGLESNRKYWVRVRTLSTAGLSAASAPVIGMVW